MLRYSASRSLRRNRWGLSEIVGSLMLVLIVVVAATAFSAFVASYQKQYQSEQQIDQQRSLESIKILGVKSFLETGSIQANTIESLNFTLASLSVNPTTLSEVAIDGNPLETYIASTLDLLTGQYVPSCVTPNNSSCPGPLVATSSATLIIPARAQFTINATVGDANGAPSSFYNTNVVMFSTEFVKLDAFTILGNDFTQSFVPPTAVATVDPIQVYTGSGSGYVTEAQLDGSGSIQNGNETIVAWNWVVTPAGGSPVQVAGEKAYFPFPQDNGMGGIPVSYTISLAVENSEGLEGSTQFSYSY